MRAPFRLRPTGRRETAAAPARSEPGRRRAGRTVLLAVVGAAAVWALLRSGEVRQLFPGMGRGHNALLFLAPWVTGGGALLAAFARRRRPVRAGAALLLFGGLALTSLYLRFVERVPIGGGIWREAVIVSWAREPDCPCGTDSNKGCIAGLKFDPDGIASCWGENRVWAVQSGLAVSFVASLVGLGLLVGAAAPSAARASPSTAAPAAPHSGSTLLHYRLLEKLGQGAMGTVYRAEDRKLGRRVALKVLPSDLAEDAARLGRFRREAEAAARLNHPNIVTLYALEESAGIHFLTMELVSGTTLERRLRPGGLPLDELLGFALPLTGAVAAAHALGIAHRDLKPGNIMISDEGALKVVDFGLARPLSGGAGPAAEAPTTLTMTRAGALLGTPAYMAPEQARGQRADERADVFALGVILYRMAAGRLPFAGDSAAEMITSILRDTPAELAALRPDLPPELGRVIAHCLAKDSASRLGSAAELHELLRGLGDR